jgi:hypothetical protein
MFDGLTVAQPSELDAVRTLCSQDPDATAILLCHLILGTLLVNHYKYQGLAVQVRSNPGLPSG